MSATNTKPKRKLPLALVQNADGKLYCVICRRYIHHEQKHMSSKRHEKSEKMTSPEENAKHRAEFLARAAGAAAAAPTSEKIKKLSLPRVESLEAIVELNPKGSHPFHKLSIDKDQFLSSILKDVGITSTDKEVSANDDDHDHSADDDGDTDSGTQAHSASRRLSGFGPVEYRPPGGVDNFFDSMPAEEERTGHPAELRAILTTATVTPKNTPVKDHDGAAPRNLDGMSIVVEDETTRLGTADARDDEMSDLEPEREDGMPPWIMGDDATDLVKYTAERSCALHFEMLEFTRFMSPTAEESGNREKCAKTVENIVQTLWPKCHIERFGSYATGLYLPSSDIDICVMETPDGGSQAELEDLARAVRNLQGFARRVTVVNARVALVKLVARDGSVQCDISFNRPNGPRNVAVIRDYLKTYPALRPVLLVLKCFLQQRALNETFTGGLGSYALLLLVVSHLQMYSFNFPGAHANLGSVLEKFLFLYGNMLNFIVTGVGVKDGGYYYDKFKKYNTPPGETSRFSIEDPNDETNEIGGNSYGIHRIRRSFMKAYDALMKWSRDNSSGPATPLSAILQHDESFRRRRKHIKADLEARGFGSLTSTISAGLFSSGRMGQKSVPPANVDAERDGSHRAKRFRSENVAASDGARGSGHNANSMGRYSQQQNHHVRHPQYNGRSHNGHGRYSGPGPHYGGYSGGDGRDQSYNGPALSSEMRMRLGNQAKSGGRGSKRNNRRRDGIGKDRGIQHPSKRGKSRARDERRSER